MAGRPAKKSLGQNFLVSEGAIRAIVREIAAPRLPVFEIGPGRGALTLPLAECGTQIAAFEIDGALAEETSAALEGFEGAEIVRADIRGVDLDAEAADRGWKRYTLAGNIPYLLTSTILLGLPTLERCSMAVIMMQREVGERVLAEPGTRQSGILPVFLQSYLTAEKVMTLRPGSFRPRPKVDSIVLKFSYISREGAPEDRDRFLSLLKKAFSQRRKKLANSLKGYRIYEGHGVDLGRRPEELALDDWFALFGSASGRED